nr:MAG TPA: hypothetical protein [Caudoviricetes sp.]
MLNVDFVGQIFAIYLIRFKEERNFKLRSSFCFCPLG